MTSMVGQQATQQPTIDDSLSTSTMWTSPLSRTLTTRPSRSGVTTRSGTTTTAMSMHRHDQRYDSDGNGIVSTNWFVVY